MDRRLLAGIFRERLRELIGQESGGVTRFARETGLDRSALSQFLNDDVDRLPRAESLRQIAETKGVTVDWLLGLSNVSEGGQELTPSVEIEEAIYHDGGTPVDRWRREIAGRKLRYVPSTLPDMMRLHEVNLYEFGAESLYLRDFRSERLLDEGRIGEMDIEISMPLQMLTALQSGGGLWSGLSKDVRRRQLRHIAEIAEARYPTIRLHLFDQLKTYAAPFTVFGTSRAAIYLGGAYLVVTAIDQVRSMIKLFDDLVRTAVVGPDRVHKLIGELLDD